MQPHEKSVNLFADCLFLLSGSGKPFLPNKHEWITLKRVNLRNLLSAEIYQISTIKE